MDNNKILTQEYIKELFNYDDGNLIWKVRRPSNVKIGQNAGCLNKLTGYLGTSINNKRYLNHRLIWLYYYGYFPENGIDHIDRDRLNNRIENLREVSQSCNLRNAKTLSNNTSGVKGVCWNKNRGQWQSGIVVNNKNINLGKYNCFTEAVAHRLAAEQYLNWHWCDSSSPASIYIQNYVNGNKNK